VVQKQRFTPVRQHCVERPAQAIPVSQPFDFGRHGYIGQFPIGLRTAAAMTPIHQPHVPGNRKDPRTNGQVRPVGSARSMDLEEGLLQEILRLTPVARQRGKVGEKRGGERGVQRLECRHGSRLVRRYLLGELSQGVLAQSSPLSPFVHTITLLGLPNGA
jgi:hypothetical protein